MNPKVGRCGPVPLDVLGSTSKIQTGKFDSVPPSTITAVFPSLSSSSIGLKKYGIDMLIRAAREILNVSGSIGVDLPGSR